MSGKKENSQDASSSSRDWRWILSRLADMIVPLYVRSDSSGGVYHPLIVGWGLMLLVQWQ
jgi:hypothetical protein